MFSLRDMIRDPGDESRVTGTNVPHPLSPSVPPGTTKKFETVLREKTTKPFHVAFQPEFLRAVSCDEDARAPWQVVFGYMAGEEDVKSRMSNAFLEFVDRDESKLTVLNVPEAEFMKLVHK